jgi:hypothetical protein
MFGVSAIYDRFFSPNPYFHPTAGCNCTPDACAVAGNVDAVFRCFLPTDLVLERSNLDYRSKYDCIQDMVG